MPGFINHVGQKVSVRDAKGQMFVGEVTRLDSDGDYGVTVPAGHHTSSRAQDAPYEWFFFKSETQDFGLTILPLDSAAPAITLLDDAGRAALKAGDRVLVEATVVENRAEGDGDRMICGEYTGGSWTQHHKASAIYALLPPAPKPIAAGDRVRILGGQVGKAIGQASDGTWAVEYDVGDNINISRYDASALEGVS